MVAPMAMCHPLLAAVKRGIPLYSPHPQQQLASGDGLLEEACGLTVGCVMQGGAVYCQKLITALQGGARSWCVCMYVCMYVFICVCVCVRVCVCVCTCIKGL